MTETEAMLDNVASTVEADFEPSQKEEVFIKEEYAIAEGCLCTVQHTKDKVCYSPLGNFRAAIVGEEIIDDGASEQTAYLIAGKLEDDTNLRLVRVPAEKFDSLDWLSQWGARVTYSAGRSVKDHLRAAIKQFSEEIQTQVTFRHTGWREFEEGYLFLHAGGAIGPDGLILQVTVDLNDPKMNNYHLPPPPDGDVLKEAIRTSLGMADLAPDVTSIPILAGTYLAPLAEFLNLDLSLFAAGMSGSQKSELTAISQAHYGAKFDRLNLPSNWEGTGNSLEKQGFLAKDVIWTIDDFCPKGTLSDIERFHKEADRVIRSQANKGGRSRMNADGTLRPTYYPRGLILSSGEDVPKGQSLKARMVVLEVKRGDVDLQKLTELQREATSGTLASAMSGYIRWLAPKTQGLKDILKEKFVALRNKAAEAGVKGHDRTPGNIAHLALGLEQLLDYAKECGALTEEEAVEFQARGWKALIEVALTQTDNEEESNPGEQFLRLLSAALTSGMAHLDDRNSDGPPPSYLHCGWGEHVDINAKHEAVPFPKGTLIGWYDEQNDNVLLETEMAFAVAQRLAREQGAPLTTTKRTMWKRLKDINALSTTDKNQTTVNRSIYGTGERRVLSVFADKILPKGSAALPSTKKPKLPKGTSPPKSVFED